MAFCRTENALVHQTTFILVIIDFSLGQGTLYAVQIELDCIRERNQRKDISPKLRRYRAKISARNIAEYIFI